MALRYAMRSASRDREGAQVLVGRGVDVPRRLQLRAVVADIAGFRDPAPADLALNADLPPLRARRLRVGIEEGDALAEERLHAERVADRLGDAVRERVRQRGDERQAVVERRDDVGVLAEAALDDVAAALAEEAVEHPVAGAEHGLGLVELVGEADARHEVVLGRLVEAARLAVDAGKRQAAADVELADRHFRRRVERVLGARRRLDRLHHARVEAADALVVDFRQRRLVFVAQAEVDRQPRADAPVVLHEEAPVLRLLVIAGRPG